MVLGSVFVIALGLGMASKVALTVVMVFFVVFANAFQGVREADKYMIANAQILGASPRQVTMSVVIPSSMSWIRVWGRRGAWECFGQAVRSDATNAFSAVYVYTLPSRARRCSAKCATKVATRAVPCCLLG